MQESIRLLELRQYVFERYMDNREEVDRFLEESINKLTADNKRISDDMQALKANMDDGLTPDVDEMREQMAALKEGVTKSDYRLNENEKEMESVIEVVNELQQWQKAHRAEEQSHMQTIDEYISVVKEHSGVINDMKKALDDAQTAVNSTNDELRGVLTEIKDATQPKASFVEDVRDALAQSKRDSEQKDRTISELKSALDALKQQQCTYSSETSKLLEEYKKELKELKDTVAGYQSKLEEKDQVIQTLRQRIDGVVGMVEEEKKFQEKQSGINETTENSLKVMANALESFKNEYCTKESFRHYDSLVNDVKTSVIGLRNASDTHHKQQNEQINELKKDSEKLSESVSALQNAVCGLASPHQSQPVPKDEEEKEDTEEEDIDDELVMKSDSEEEEDIDDEIINKSCSPKETPLDEETRKLLEEVSAKRVGSVLYRGTDDGFSVEDFNRCVGGHQNVLFYVKTTEGEQFGGYCSDVPVVDDVAKGVYGDKKHYVFVARQDGISKFTRREENSYSAWLFPDDSDNILCFAGAFVVSTNCIESETSRISGNFSRDYNVSDEQVLMNRPHFRVAELLAVCVEN